MVLGESAGATNVCTLVASPLAAGLFTSALMESGGCGAHSQATQKATSAEATSHSPSTAAAVPSQPPLPVPPGGEIPVAFVISKRAPSAEKAAEKAADIASADAADKTAA